jgi:uncharacterized membrane protein YeaQ/YmgE (transglycosylase-associated protein family)
MYRNGKTRLICNEFRFSRILAELILSLIGATIVLIIVGKID